MINSKTRTLAGVLLRSGSSYREISDALEISVGSVHNISREDMDYLQPLVTEMKRRSAFKCYLLADHTLSRMSDADFERADLRQKSIAAAILYDKGAMLDGIMPGPDEQPWDQSKPGEMGRLFWPESESGAHLNEGHRFLLMRLFMQGRDADARRIGRQVGMDQEDIEACRNWQEEFDPPATQIEARLWKKLGKLRKDYDESVLPKDEEEKKEWDWQEEKKELSRKIDDLYGLKPIDYYDNREYDRSGRGYVDSQQEHDDPGVEACEGDSADERSAGVTETGRTLEPAPPEVGMRRVLNERFLSGLNALKAKMELNGIEQAVDAQPAEKQKKTTRPDEKIEHIKKGRGMDFKGAW